MKKEDIANALNEVKDVHVDSADRLRPRKRRWVTWTALAAALALTVGLWAHFAMGRNRPAENHTSDTEAPPQTGDGTARVLAAADFPSQAQHPEKYNQTAYDAWLEDSSKRRLTEEEIASLDRWKETAVPVLLGGGEGENRVVSPLSIYLALAELAETAAGRTREEILAALGADSVGSLRTLANRVWNAVYLNDGTALLGLGSSVWLKEGEEYRQEVLDILADSYYADSFAGEMGSEDYNGLLQNWLNVHTGGLLEEQAGGVELAADTIYAISTAIYLKADWVLRFNPRLTEQDVFHAPDGDVEREFMHQKLLARTLDRGERFSGITLGLSGDSDMRLMLPDEGISPQELLNDADAVAWLTQMTGEGEASGKQYNIDLRLPRFDVVTDAKINDAARALGITAAFGSDADFTPLTGDTGVYLNEILHAARVKIDEDGCEGAAYTVEALNGMAPSDAEDIDLTFDRPFLFSVVRDGVTVFAGVVYEP